MQKMIYLISVFGLISCANPFYSSSIGEKSDPSNYEIYTEPKIYLSKEDRLIKFSELNRNNFLLSLSDQIFFSNKEEEDIPPRLDQLGKFKNEEDVKIKISSFCSDIIDRPDNKSNNQSDRLIQEVGSSSYRWSFSIFELLPKEILSSNLDKIFYCSFVFAFKDEEEIFNYYTMVHQPIEPSFPDPINKLSLVRKTESGHYLYMDSRVINAQNIYKISILNQTRRSIKSYHLFCEGLEVAVFYTELSTKPIFLNLMNYNSESLPEQVEQCRIFSKNDEGVTGMTDSFTLDFNSLNSHINSVDLEKIDEPVVMKLSSNKEILSGHNIPLNSYFKFNNLNGAGLSDQDYSTIGITVNTQCFNKRVFGEGNVVSESYNFSLRERFPVMAVTPKKIFIMDIMSYGQWLDKKEDFLNGENTGKRFSLPNRNREVYTSSCLYKIQLTDRSNLENKKEFKDKIYFIEWSNKSYGIDYSPLVFYGSISPIVEGEPKARQFLRLEDIYKSRAGHLNFSFFDTFDDKSFQIDGMKVNRMIMECHSGKDQKGNADSLKVTWPYSSQNNSILLKTLFDSDLIEYIQRKTLAVCRLMLYEDEILRYFSGEMKITQ